MRGAINPLAKLVVVASIVATASMTRSLSYLLYLLAISLAPSLPSLTMRMPKPLLLSSPMAVGLGWFNAVVSGDPTLGLVVALRVFVLVAASAIFALTTDPYDFALSLIHQLKVPYQVAFAVAVAYGMLHEALRHYRDFLEALRARWLARNEVEALRFIGAMARGGMAAIANRVERLAFLMDIKGFGNPARTYSRRMEFGALDAIFIAAALTAIAVPAFLP